MKKVKYFFGVIHQSHIQISEIINILSDAFGGLDKWSESFPFGQTKYYEEEMGSHLSRFFVGLTHLKSPLELAAFKKDAMMVEQEFFTVKKKRVVNLDPGYVDEHKIVLASVKDGGQKIPIAENIFADMVMKYQKGSFQSFEWTFPDFASKMYDPFFLEQRELYLKVVKD